MTTFQVAYIREQNQDIIIVVVGSQFGAYNNQDQNRLCKQLQVAANAAGLKGTVVPVWETGNGRMAFLAPSPWVSYFRSMTLRDVALNLNRTLTVNW